MENIRLINILKSADDDIHFWDVIIEEENELRQIFQINIEEDEKRIILKTKEYE